MRGAYQVDTGLFPVGGYSREDWRRLRWGYYRMIEKVDAEIGAVLDALRVAGLAENTLIIFTSDHGECAGSHRFNQKTVFYDESARVPLIIVWRDKLWHGTTDRLVNIGVDLLPTMLDFAGLTVPEHLPGRSLKPVVLGGATDSWRDFIVVENHMAQAGEVDGVKPQLKGRMVRTARYKYCAYSAGERRESLVDMQVDPGETRNLANNPDYSTTLEQHRALLSHFGKEHNDPSALELLTNEVGPVPFYTHFGDGP
jgi:arylsulfatase A-like enzyme